MSDGVLIVLFICVTILGVFGIAAWYGKDRQ